MMTWRVEKQGDILILDTPDGAASMVLDGWSALRLGTGLIQAIFSGGDDTALQSGDVAEIRCETFVFIPYCSVCTVKDVKPLKSAKSPIPPNHQFSGQNPTLQGPVTRLLFETRIGDLVLALVERWLGLAVITAGELTP
jgi:hypothetical protein